MLIWLGFFLCLAVIGVAGVKLSRYGDAIADKTGIGRTWVGLVLLATVTSLPELVTGVSSVTVAQVPEIALGDVLGSCVFNMLIIVVLDLLHRGETMYSSAASGHILAGGFGIMLIGIAGFGILLSALELPLAIGHVGLYTPVIIVVYLVAMQTVFRYESRQVQEFTAQEPDKFPGLTTRAIAVRYAIAAAFVVVAGIVLPFVGEGLAEQMGWNESFVGTLFVALVTSVPELVVTVAALRLGALDMAIGNLFGSNLFNIGILAIDDLLFLQGPLFAHVSSIHALSALSAIMMTAMAVVGFFYRPNHRLAGTIGWSSVFLLVVYLANTLALYVLG